MEEGDGEDMRKLDFQWLVSPHLSHHLSISQTINRKVESLCICQTPVFSSFLTSPLHWKMGFQKRGQENGFNQTIAVSEGGSEPRLILRLYFPPNTIFEKLITYSWLSCCRLIGMCNGFSVNLLNKDASQQSEPYSEEWEAPREWSFKPIEEAKPFARAASPFSSLQ